MDRRIFLQKACSGILLLSASSLIACDKKKKVRFGVITDLHYAGKEPRGTRYFNQSIEKLQMALDEFRKADLDFIIELGDFKDQDDDPRRETTLAYLDQVEEVYQSYPGPVYHVLGNHDMDSISKAEFLSHISNHGQAGQKPYYSFINQGIKFIVLDACNNEDGSDYDSGNFDWQKAYITPPQKEWLEGELTGHSHPVIVFIHQMLDSFSEISPSLCVANAKEIVSVLEQNGNVLAVFQGHHHPGHYSFRNGIHYWTMPGAIEQSLPENNSFAIVDIDQERNIYIDGYYNCKDRELPKV